MTNDRLYCVLQSTACQWKVHHSSGLGRQMTEDDRWRARLGTAGDPVRYSHRPQWRPFVSVAPRMWLQQLWGGTITWLLSHFSDYQSPINSLLQTNVCVIKFLKISWIVKDLFIYQKPERSMPFYDAAHIICTRVAAIHYKWKFCDPQDKLWTQRLWTNKQAIIKYKWIIRQWKSPASKRAVRTSKSKLTN